jgi:general secretion pathway protein J
MNTSARPACGASPAQQGFTLIEVLVALVLLAVMSLIAWRGLDAVQHASERVDAQAGQTLSLIGAWGQLERDLRRHAGEDVLPLWQATGDGAGPAGLAMLAPGIAWARASGLHLVRSTDDGRWQQLHWYVLQGTLYRAAGAASARLPLPEPEDAVAVLGGLNGWSLRAWRDGQGWADPQTPQPKTPADRPGQGPAARRGGAADSLGLEIVLQRREHGVVQGYRKVVLLP